MQFKPPMPDLAFLKELTSSCRGKGPFQEAPRAEGCLPERAALAGTRQVSPATRREAGHFTGGALSAHQMAGARPIAETEYRGGF